MSVCLSASLSLSLSRMKECRATSDNWSEESNNKNPTHTRNTKGGGGKQCHRKTHLPGSLWSNVKVLFEEEVTTGSVLDHLDVVGRGFVVHAPAAVDKLELPVCDELCKALLGGLAALHPPALKEAGLNVDELAVWVFFQARHDRVQDVVDVLGVVLVDGDEPARVIVGVGHKMHVDLSLHGA